MNLFEKNKKYRILIDNGPNTRKSVYEGKLIDEDSIWVKISDKFGNPIAIRKETIVKIEGEFDGRTE